MRQDGSMKRRRPGRGSTSAGRIASAVAVAGLVVTIAAPAAASSDSGMFAWYEATRILIALDPGDDGPAVERLQRALAKEKFYKGPIDGSYGNETSTAVVAFHKFLDMPRTSSWAQTDWLMVLNLPEPNIPDRWDETERVEMDLSKQLLFLVKGGDVQAILPISSGGNYTYWSERNQRDVRAGTPRGDFTFNWYRKGWREDSTTE